MQRAYLGRALSIKAIFASRDAAQAGPREIALHYQQTSKQTNTNRRISEAEETLREHPLQTERRAPGNELPRAEVWQVEGYSWLLRPVILYMDDTILLGDSPHSVGKERRGAKNVERIRFVHSCISQKKCRSHGCAHYSGLFVGAEFMLRLTTSG